MELEEFNSKQYEYCQKQIISLENIILFFGDKFEILPKSYINMLINYNNMCNECYLISLDLLFGVLMNIENKEC